MNIKIPTLWLCALAATAFSGNALAGDEEDRTELTRLEQEWVDASSHGDRAALERILAPSFVNTTLRGIRRTRAMVLAAPPAPQGSSQQLRDIRIEITDGTAIVTGINVFMPAPGATPIEVAYTDVFVRNGNTWRAVASQETLKRQAP